MWAYYLKRHQNENSDISEATAKPTVIQNINPTPAYLPNRSKQAYMLTCEVRRILNAVTAELTA